MSARHRVHRSSFALTQIAAAGIIAAMPAVANAQMQAVMIGGVWSGWMSQGSVSQAALPTGGLGTQVMVKTNYLGGPLLDFITASIAGKVATTSLMYASYNSLGQGLNAWKIGGARIQRVDLPTANAATAIPTFVGVTFGQALAEAGGKPTSGPPGNPRGQALQSNLFHLQFDSLDATTAMAIDSMPIFLPNVLKGENLPQLRLTYSVASTSSSQAFDKALHAWLTSQTLRNGTLTFFTTGFTTPLLVEHFRGLRVVSINGAGASMVATFTMTGISLGAVAP